MPRLLYPYQSSRLLWSASCPVCFIISKAPLSECSASCLVSFFNYQSSLFEWSALCLFCFIITKAPRYVCHLHTPSALPLTKLTFSVVSFIIRLLYNYQSSPFREVRFMPLLLYILKSSPLWWLASCLVCFIITNAPL
jgi:hypothetical protein